ILFASEMIGAVRGIDPETGHHYDDTKRYIDQLPLSAEEKGKIFESNARRVYGRLSRIIEEQSARAIWAGVEERQRKGFRHRRAPADPIDDDGVPRAVS